MSLKSLNLRACAPVAARKISIMMQISIAVASGSYFFRLRVGDQFMETRRGALLK